MVEILGDPDMNCVGKLSNKDTQRFRVEVIDANDVLSVKEWSLAKLELVEDV